MTAKDRKEKPTIVVSEFPRELIKLLDNELSRLYDLIKSGTADAERLQWATNRIEFFQNALLKLGREGSNLDLLNTVNISDSET